MKVSELHAQSQGEATAEYVVVVEQPGVVVAPSQTPLLVVSGVYRDTANGRLVLQVDEVIER
jgi:hypothetical protein